MRPAYVVWSGVDAGRCYAQRDSAVPRGPIASITKLMTVLVALDHLSLDDVVVVPRAATRIGEATINLRQRASGSRCASWWRGRADPESANDAATALALAAAEGSLSRFVSWMNQKARDLGLPPTRISSTRTGWTFPGRVSSARDVVDTASVPPSQIPFVRRYAGDRAAEARATATWRRRTTCSSKFPALLAGEDGSHRAGQAGRR